MSDSTFQGYSHSDVAGQFITKGKWTISNDTLRLTPEKNLSDSTYLDSLKINTFSVSNSWLIKRNKIVKFALLAILSR